MLDGEMHRGWGRRVAKHRVKRFDWTQAQLAKEVGCDVATISRIERGIQVPRDTMKWKIAGALRMTVEELFPYPDVRPPVPEQVAS